MNPSTRFATVLAPCVLAGALCAQAEVLVTSSHTADGKWFHVQVSRAEGTAIALTAGLGSPDAFSPSFGVPLGVATLDAAGNGQLDIFAKNEMLQTWPKNTSMTVGGAYLGTLGIQESKSDGILVNPACEELDFDWRPGAVKLETGEVVSEQWADAGVHITGENYVSGHPDKILIFDSSNRTGGDTDLATPGPGTGNDTALGKLLIIAEDDVDADMDGLIDDPDDEEGGGTMTFDFDDPVTVCSITVVDIEEAGSEVRFYDDGGLLKTVPLTGLGDNSVQTIGFTADQVTQMVVDLHTSGGVGMINLVPCPSRLQFDESTFGEPLDLSAGTKILDQFAALGIHISAFNNVAGHPDQAILFDSANPTGGDSDLATPGSGVGNDTEEGLILILAENVDDGDTDGIVDNPDDEALGGMLAFDYDYDIRFVSARVIDIDSYENAYFEAYDDGMNSLGVFPLDALGDNSGQTIEPGIGGVRRIELHLSGSGGLAELVTCPDVEDVITL